MFSGNDKKCGNNLIRALRKVNVFLRKSTYNKKVPLRQSSGRKNISAKCLKGNFSNSL